MSRRYLLPGRYRLDSFLRAAVRSHPTFADDIAKRYGSATWIVEHLLAIDAPRHDAYSRLRT